MTQVLVADDSETILLLLRTRLEMEGYEVTTVADGVEAMTALAGMDPDVILLDAMMPRKSGFDVLRELRAAGDETPVLIVSAHQNREDSGAPAELDVSGFLGKPIDFEDLLARVAELTASS
jgi:two-component system response regulator MprA